MQNNRLYPFYIIFQRMDGSYDWAFREAKTKSDVIDFWNETEKNHIEAGYEPSGATIIKVVMVPKEGFGDPKEHNQIFRDRACIYNTLEELEECIDKLNNSEALAIIRSATSEEYEIIEL